MGDMKNGVYGSKKKKQNCAFQMRRCWLLFSNENEKFILLWWKRCQYRSYRPILQWMPIIRDKTIKFFCRNLLFFCLDLKINPALFGSVFALCSIQSDRVRRKRVRLEKTFWRLSQIDPCTTDTHTHTYTH